LSDLAIARASWQGGSRPRVAQVAFVLEQVLRVDPTGEIALLMSVRDAACHLARARAAVPVAARLLALAQVVVGLLQGQMASCHAALPGQHAPSTDRLNSQSPLLTMGFAPGDDQDSHYRLSDCSGAAISAPRPPRARRCGNGKPMDLMSGSWTSSPRHAPRQAIFVDVDASLLGNGSSIASALLRTPTLATTSAWSAGS